MTTRGRPVRGVRASLMLAPLVAALTVSGYSSTPLSVTVNVSAATFSATVTPSPSVVRRGVNMRISWPAVSISSGDPVRYRVMLISPPSAPSEVCTGVDLPVESGGIVSCTDRKPGSTPTYSVQAFVAAPDGTPTWSLPASPAVAP